MSLSYEAALQALMADPNHRQLMFDTYVESEPLHAAVRFHASVEWVETLKVLGPLVKGARVLDLGAGNGIASWAFAQSGVAVVYALEPHPGELAGRGAIARLQEPRITVLDATGEAIPVRDEAVDLVYARQVLHHAGDLQAMVAEAARILRPGGMALFAREHVVDDDAQLAMFLAGHPVHRLAGGEHAYSLRAYVDAIRGSGLRITQVLGPRDSIINAFPDARDGVQLAVLVRRELTASLGWLRSRVLVKAATALPGALTYGRWRARRVGAGRLFSFVAMKSG